MNKQYKVIWSKVKNSYVVVSELAKRNGKAGSTHSQSGQKIGVALSVLALCAGLTAGVSAADQYYSVNDMNGALSQFGNKSNDGAQGVGSVAAGAGAKVESASGSFQGAMATVVGSLNTVAAGTQTVVPFDGVANSIVGVANATQNANATLIFGAGNAVSNSYGDVSLNIGSINPADPIDTAQKLGAAVGDSGGQILVIGGANTVDYARFSAITGVSNTLNGKSDKTSDYNFITGAKNKLTNTGSTYVIGSNNTVSDGTSNIVIGDKRKLTSTTGNVVIGSADEEKETTISGATILGQNANATAANGVALGSGSVASVAKGVVGTVPTGATVSDTDKASATWTSTLGAVSVGDSTNNLTRQITGVAAGTQATDAVNVAQLNAVNTKVDNNAIHFFSARGLSTQNNYNNAAAKGEKSLAVGASSEASGHLSTVVGPDTLAMGWGSTVMGNMSTTMVMNSDKIPFDNSADSFEYTFKRDSDGNFIDTGLRGGYSTSLGVLNSIYAIQSKSVSPLDGLGNTLIGGFNETDNANGAFIFGWQNKITNSYFTNDANLPNTLSELTGFHSDGFGGSVVAIGMDNTVDGAQHSYIMGTANTVNGKVTSSGTVEEVATDNVVIGDNHKVDNASHTVILGSADTEATTDKDGVVVIGHNANATVADGVALGSNSVASVAAGVAGTVPTGATVSDTDKASATWTSTLGAVSVGDTANNLTRQITGVAAGTQATDAVNVAQLNAVNTSLTNSVNANKIHFFHVNSTSGTNYNNDGAKGANSIAIGQATTNASNSIVMGTGAKMNSYVNQPGGIAIGANSFVENMSGGLERTFDFGQAGYDKLPFLGTPYGSPKDASRMTTGVAIGQNTYARSGAIMLGTHNYKGELGDVTVDSANSKSPNMTIFSTTLGANSYSNGLFSTLTGAYSIASSNYSGGTDNATKNFGATINGAFNSIESSTSDNESSGIGNSVVGLANRTANSNGALIFGAGNEIKNSITNISVPIASAPDSAKGMQTLLMNSIKASNSGGSTLAIGGANKANYTQQSALIGVNNTLEGTESSVAQYNALTGFNNKATGVTNVTVTGSNNTVSESSSIVNLGNENAVEDSNNTILLGDNRTVTGSDNSIILGRANNETTTTFRAAADTTLTTTADNVVVMGYNANATIDDGVALGSNSVANVNKGQLGYNPSSEELTAAEKASATWTSTLGSVAVGTSVDGAVATATRQITGVAAGTQDTDAVNVAQLKANKVTLEEGDNVKITSEVDNNGSTTYTIKSTDTNTTLASGTVTYVGADGTLVLTDSDGNDVKVTGFKNIYLTDASLSGNTLTLTQNEGAPITVTGIATTADLATNKVKYFSVKSELAANQNNDGAKGTNSIAIGPNAKAEHENGIALGTNVLSGGKGSIVIGSDARVAQNIALDGSIVIGKGAEAFTGGGEQEALLGMDPTNWPNRGVGGYDNPTDASRVATSIVIGTNASGRTGSIDIGDRVYKGTMGGKEITDKNSSFHVNQTTLGTNTYNKGLFSTMVGSYSIATGGYDGSGRLNTGVYGAQNFGATVMGSLNSIRSNGGSNYTRYQGIANTIVGLGNITDNTNGSLVFGAGNKISNSITSISMPTTGADSVDEMVDKLQSTIKSSNSGGATLAIGGGNTANYTQASSIIGVNNTLTGTSSDISQYNFISGYKNTVTESDNATVIGINRTLTNVDNTIVIGSADSAIETTASDAVAVGRNTNVTIDGGVALGANSVARTDKGVVGYDPSGKITDADSILGSNTQYQTLQTEVADAQATVDTVNSEISNIQSVLTLLESFPNYEDNPQYQEFKANYDAKQSELAEAQANLDGKQSALAEAGKALYTWQSTAGSVSVGDVSKGITRQITDVAAGTADTDAVNVAQLKANKVSLVQGDNVTITSAAADDGGTTYTIASTDTYTESGTYDADSKKIKFTQNDTTKNYEVDLSELVDGIGEDIDKGLNFAGDSGDTINKKLDETINIVGGATDVTTGSNIGVVSEDGKLNVRLAKDLTGLNSVKVGDAVTLGTTGLTITNGPSVTTAGINAGNQKITNVVAGVADTDAVNVSQLNANKIHYFHVNSAANGTNYNNNGATGTDAIAIGKATAMPHNSVVIGNNAQALDSNGGKGSGDVAIGNGARINNYADQSASIAIGQNAQIDNMAGQQEALFSLGQTTFSGGILSSARIPADPSKVATGIAIGENTFVRSGGLMIGTHNYRGALGDVDVDSANTRATGVNINATTLGTNSYNNGAFSTITGAYSIATGNYAGGRNTTDAAKNFGATIMGSLNSVESATASSRFSGIANSVVGTANRTFNANGSLIFGAGNEITNSVTNINAPTSAGGSAKDLQTTLMSAIKSSASGGSTLAIGGGNKADYTLRTAIIGVNNTVTGKDTDVSQENYVTGFNNTGENVDNVTIIGTNRTVSDASNSVVIGSADSVMTSSASDAVTIGRNANTTINGGVALGSGSVASTDKEVAGYDVTTGKASTQTSATWKSTAAAVSVGDVENDVTRQITGVAAGMEDTDAVNVAQLRQVAEAASDAGKTTLKFTGDDTSEDATIARSNGQTLNIIGGAKATDADGNSLLTDNNIGVVKDGDDALKVQLAKDLTGLNSVKVGDVVTLGTTGLIITNGPSVTTKGIDAGSKKITNVEAGTNDTDAVNVSQLNSAIKGAKHTKITLNGASPTAGANGALGEYIGSSNLTMAVQDVDGQKVYDLKMSKDLVAGTKPGADGKNGEAGSITIIGEPGKDGADGKNTSANITVKDGKNGLDGTDGITRIVYKDEDGTDHEIATMDDGLNFTGDTENVTIAKKLNETLSITGGITDADQLTTEDNIGVVASNSGLKVRLAKDLQDLNSVRIGGTTENGKGIYIANQSIKNTKGTAEEGNYITGLTNKTWNPTANGYVTGRAATEDQLNSVYETINQNIESSKAVSGKNITVDENNKVNLKDNITLGGDTAANQVNINGNDAKVTAGDGTNKVVVDGSTGQVTIGSGVVLGNQTNVEGTKSDGTKDSQKGQYLTGLTNTTWDPATQGVVENRAATEGQLKDIADQISNIDTAVKSSSRVFESDSTEQVTRKNTDPMKLKGGATGELSDNNIGVVNNSDKTGFDIKLAKDIKGINTIEVNNSVKIGTGDKQTTIEGDTINTGSVATGNTTINNGGLTIVNEDKSKNITIENNNISMGGNVIHNVGDGEKATDAINKGQFDRAISSIDNGMGQMNNRINKLDNRIDRVGAGAAALAALHPLEFSPEAKWEVSAGVGNYKGASAVALGAFYRPNGDTMFSVGTSLGGGENMINAGVTLRVGDGETQNYPSKKVMAQEITDLKAVVADQNERLADQNDKIEELTRLVNSLINNR